MTTTQKYIHMTALPKADKASRRLVFRLTMPENAAMAALEYLDLKPPNFFFLFPDTCHAKLWENWRMKFAAMWATPGYSVQPRGPESSWNPRLLPTLCMLSDMTVGQATMARRAVVGTVRAKGRREMRVKDVESVILELYRSLS